MDARSEMILSRLKMLAENSVQLTEIMDTGRYQVSQHIPDNN